MSDVADIIDVQVPDTIRGRVFFVHGLGGHHLATWKVAGYDNGDAFWPCWLGHAFPTVALYSIDYPNAVSAWSGHAMDLQQRADSILHLLEVNALLDLPCVFVVHSMGGLLIKQMLSVARDRSPAQQALCTATVGVLFLATPHTGSSLAAGLARVLAFLPSDALSALAADTGLLLGLQSSFRAWHGRTQTSGRAALVSSMYETKRTMLLMIVPAGRADPGTSGNSIAVDANHLEIAKPHGTRHPVFLEAQRLIASAFSIDPVSIHKKRAQQKGGTRPALAYAVAATVAAVGGLACWLSAGLLSQEYRVLISALVALATFFVSRNLVSDRKGPRYWRLRAHHTCRRAHSHEDLRAIRALAVDELGEDVSGINLMKEWFRTYPRSFFVITKTDRTATKTSETIVGYFALLPLTYEATTAIEAGTLRGNTIPAAGIAKRGTCGAVYIGGIVVKGTDAKALALSHLNTEITERLAKRSKRILTRPTTRRGLRLVTNFGFSSLNGEAPVIDELCEIDAESWIHRSTERDRSETRVRRELPSPTGIDPKPTAAQAQSCNDDRDGSP